MIGRLKRWLHNLVVPREVETVDLRIFDGMEVPPHLVGKPFDIIDADGRLVARVHVRKQ